MSKTIQTLRQELEEACNTNNADSVVAIVMQIPERMKELGDILDAGNRNPVYVKEYIEGENLCRVLKGIISVEMD